MRPQRRLGPSIIVLVGVVLAISMVSCKTDKEASDGGARSAASATKSSSNSSASTASKSSTPSPIKSKASSASKSPTPEAKAATSPPEITPAIVAHYQEFPFHAFPPDAAVPATFPAQLNMPPAGSISPRLTTGGAVDAVFAGGATGSASFATSSLRVRCEALPGTRYWAFGVNVDPFAIGGMGNDDDYVPNSYNFAVEVRPPIRSIGDVSVAMSVGPDASRVGPFSGQENLQEPPTRTRITVTPSADSRSVQASGMVALTSGPMNAVIEGDVSFSVTITCAAVPSEG